MQDVREVWICYNIVLINRFELDKSFDFIFIILIEMSSFVVAMTTIFTKFNSTGWHPLIVLQSNSYDLFVRIRGYFLSPSKVNNVNALFGCQPDIVNTKLFGIFEKLTKGWRNSNWRGIVVNISAYNFQYSQGNEPRLPCTLLVTLFKYCCLNQKQHGGIPHSAHVGQSEKFSTIYPSKWRQGLVLCITVRSPSKH